jgi:hypothetical protein
MSGVNGRLLVATLCISIRSLSGPSRVVESINSYAYLKSYFNALNLFMALVINSY